MAKHDPCHVANYFINRSIEENRPFTPLQIQKMVFFAHGWTLAFRQEPLLEREFEAWTYGPVMPAIYHNLSYYGGGAVTQPILARALPFDDFENNILSQVYDLYGKFDGLQLSAMSHTPGGPWDKTWRRYKRQSVIPDETVREYFKDLHLRHTNART